MKAQLQNRIACSISEVDHHEVWQRSRLTLACVAREAREADRLVDEAERWLSGQGFERSPMSGTWCASMTGRGGAMRRVNEAIKAVVSETIPTLKDPRIGFVTVTGVETTSDLAQATVWLSVFGGAKQRTATLVALEGAAGVLQGHVNRELHLRRTRT